MFAPLPHEVPLCLTCRIAPSPGLYCKQCVEFLLPESLEKEAERRIGLALLGAAAREKEFFAKAREREVALEALVQDCLRALFRPDRPDGERARLRCRAREMGIRC